MLIVERLAAFVIGICLPILAACLILSQLSGCINGGRVYFGYERIDELQETRKLINQPWRCLFVDCKAEEIKNGNKN